jgi:hypothetical protein
MAAIKNFKLINSDPKLQDHFDFCWMHPFSKDLNFCFKLYFNSEFVSFHSNRVTIINCFKCKLKHFSFLIFDFT